MMGLNDEKDKEKKEDKNNKETSVLKSYTIKGPELGDTKTVRIYPGGYIQIIDGGI